MKSKILAQNRKVKGASTRGSKGATTLRLLPISATERHRLRTEEWRQRLCWTRNKSLFGLEPQYRELVRKLAHSMRQAGLPRMWPIFQIGLLYIWDFTGSFPKLEEFIIDVLKGRVFYMATGFFPNEIHAILADLPERERFTSLLLYNPNRYQNGYSLEAGPKPTSFLDYLGPPSADKPWLIKLEFELEEWRKQAAAALGREAAEALWAEDCSRRGRGNSGAGEGLAESESKTKVQKISYW